MLNSTKEATIPSASSSSGTAPPTSSSTSPARKSTGTSIPANGTPTQVSRTGFSGRDFAAGFIPGLILGIIATAALMLYLLRRKRNPEKDSIFNEKPDRQISDPIYNPQFTVRTDFLHKRTASAPSTTAVASSPKTTFGGYYNPSIHHPSPSSSSDHILATPTPAPKRTHPKSATNGLTATPSTPPLRVRALFTTAKSPSLRRKKSTRSLARKASDKASDVSEATIDVRMSHGTRVMTPPLGRGGGLYPPTVTRPGAAAAAGPAGESRRGTTYSDVLRAIGGEGSLAPAGGKGLGSPWRGKEGGK